MHSSDVWDSYLGKKAEKIFSPLKSQSIATSQQPKH